MIIKTLSKVGIEGTYQCYKGHIWHTYRQHHAQWAKTKSIFFKIRNKTGESRHPCLVPNLEGNSFSFCPLSMMFAVGLSYMAFIMFRYVLSMPILWRIFIISGCWILSKVFLHLLVWSCGFYLSFFMHIITFIDLYCTNLVSPG